MWKSYPRFLGLLWVDRPIPRKYLELRLDNHVDDARTPLPYEGAKGGLIGYGDAVSACTKHCRLKNIEGRSCPYSSA